jgi:hypothetical protein
MGKLVLTAGLVSSIAAIALLNLRKDINPRPYLLFSTWASTVSAGLCLYAFIVRGEEIVQLRYGFFISLIGGAVSAASGFIGLQQSQ